MWLEYARSGNTGQIESYRINYGEKGKRPLTPEMQQVIDEFNAMVAAAEASEANRKRYSVDEIRAMPRMNVVESKTADGGTRLTGVGGLFMEYYRDRNGKITAHRVMTPKNYPQDERGAAVLPREMARIINEFYGKAVYEYAEDEQNQVQH